MLGERTITIDCDVLKADAGTRMASISGGYVALVMLIQDLQYKKIIKDNPIINQVAGLSVGLLNNEILVDPDYLEDSVLDMDLNLVLDKNMSIVEIQGAAEGKV